MVADTAEELHDAAGRLGIPRRAAQDKGRTLHYDLPDEWRERAIADGVAIPISWRELARRRATMAPGAKRSGPNPPRDSGPALDSRRLAEEDSS
jgi:Protein of unknown function (DUF4031)